MSADNDWIHDVLKTADGLDEPLCICHAFNEDCGYHLYPVDCEVAHCPCCTTESKEKRAPLIIDVDTETKR